LKENSFLHHVSEKEGGKILVWEQYIFGGQITKFGLLPESDKLIRQNPFQFRIMHA
jgi:hypothetical protein